MELTVRLHEPVALPPGREDSQPDRQTDSQPDRQIANQTDKQTARQIASQPDKQTAARQTDRLASRQRAGQTDRLLVGFCSSLFSVQWLLWHYGMTHPHVTDVGNKLKIGRQRWINKQLWIAKKRLFYNFGIWLTVVLCKDQRAFWRMRL